VLLYFSASLRSFSDPPGKGPDDLKNQNIAI